MVIYNELLESRYQENLLRGIPLDAPTLSELEKLALRYGVLPLAQGCGANPSGLLRQMPAGDSGADL